MDERVERAALLEEVGRRVLAVQMRGGPDARTRDAVVHLHHTLAWASLHEIRVERTIPMDPRHNAKVDYARLRRRSRPTLAQGRL